MYCSAEKGIARRTGKAGDIVSRADARAAEFWNPRAPLMRHWIGRFSLSGDFEVVAPGSVGSFYSVAPVVDDPAEAERKALQEKEEERKRKKRMRSKRNLAVYVDCLSSSQGYCSVMCLRYDM